MTRRKTCRNKLPTTPLSQQRILCRNKEFSIVTEIARSCVATGFGAGIGDLDRDRGFLYHDRVLLVLCHDRMWSKPGGLVSRHRNCVATGWRDGRAPTCAANELCRDRLLKAFCHDREFSVTIEIVRPRVAIELLCRDRA